MHINDIQHFDIIKSYIQANNMITLNMKQNRHPVVKLYGFQDLYIKPRLLINMHDITNKNKCTSAGHGLSVYLQMTCILCIVLEISCSQAFLDKITLSSAHYAY